MEGYGTAYNDVEDYDDNNVVSINKGLTKLSKKSSEGTTISILGDNMAYLASNVVIR